HSLTHCPTRQPLPGSLNRPYGHYRTLLRQLLPTLEVAIAPAKPKLLRLAESGVRGYRDQASLLG
ncbi:MAG: hypothetical protein ACYCX9_11340, partial [Candidatus Dormibacteria bacterium]